MKIFLFCALLYQTTFLFAQLPTRDTLRFSQVIFRHGDRSPRRTFGNYAKNNATIWPEGMEKLTDLGKSQAYELGQFLRTRYDGFLSTSYNPDEILILSSHIERCVKTGLSCLQGIYRHYNDAATWAESRTVVPPFEPIPIRTIPEEYDRIFTLDAYCPKREELLNVPYRTFLEQRHYQDEPETLEYIFRNAGETALFESPPNSTKIHDQYYAIEETIFCLTYANKTLEDWMIPLLSNELFLLYPYVLQVEEHTGGLQAQRLNAGSMVQLILDNYAAHLNGTLGKKLVLYSTHDKTITNVMFAFDIISALQNRIPPYASGLLMELHQLPDYDEPVIEFWYRKSTTKTLERADSPSCGVPCTLGNLVRITSHLVDVDYEAECKLT